MKKQNKQNGITLVALVITIIILLILAGISISALTGSELFEKAQQTKNKTENAQAEENATLAEYEQWMGNYIGGSTPGETEKTLTDTAETKPAQAMPANATVIENDLSKGIVIKDSKNNEWVWVVVPMSVTTGKTTDTDIETALKEYATTNYTGNWTDEYYYGCGMTKTEYNTTKSKMLQSIKTYGGFWISRYEAGIKGTDTDTTKARKTHTNITDGSIEAVSQANMIPYNYVYCSEAQALAKKMSTDTSKTSSLLFGIQWDLTCKFLEGKDGLNIGSINSDSSSWGNYKDSSLLLYRGKYNTSPDSSDSKWLDITAGEKNDIMLLTTGASEDAKKMNIYDFAGNEKELTLEHATSDTILPYASRGGSFNYNGSPVSASGRSSSSKARLQLHRFSFRTLLRCLKSKIM